MEALGIKEVQEISLKTLMHIDHLCREHGLKYTIYYGSLIGLERHGGWIPWDDDIDLVMLRPDYQRLMTILAEDPAYTLLSFETRDDYRYPFAKVIAPHTSFKTKQYCAQEDKQMGVFVDIFPLDGVPSDQKLRMTQYQTAEQARLNMMDSLGNAYARSMSFGKSLVKRVVRFPHHRQLVAVGGYQHWREAYQHIATQYPVADQALCGYMEFINRDWGIFPTTWFASDQFEDVQFEGQRVMAIKHRVDFLKLRFGDYMQLPPENERVTHHPYTFYKD